MKIDMSAVLKTIKQLPLKEESVGGQEPTDLTLGTVCINALLSPVEASVSGKEKLARYQLATKISGSGEIDLTPEEVTKLRDLIGKGYGTIVVGQAWGMLDTNTEKGN